MKFLIRFLAPILLSSSLALAETAPAAQAPAPAASAAASATPAQPSIPAQVSPQQQPEQPPSSGASQGNNSKSNQPVSNIQVPELNSQESLTRIRDPFQKPSMSVTAGPPKSDLERYPVEQFELLGVMTGPVKMRAMVRGPDKKTHVVSEQVKMGTRNGAVRVISSSSITVREKVLNVFGQEEEVDTELKLLPKATAGS